MSPGFQERCSTANASVLNSNTQSQLWLILLLTSVGTVRFVEKGVTKLSGPSCPITQRVSPLPSDILSIGAELMEIRKCSTRLARLGLVIPLMRHATLTFSCWLREVNRLFFSSTPSSTQYCLQKRLLSTWLFLVANNWCSTLVEPSQSYYCTAPAWCFSNLLWFTDSVGTHVMIKPPVIKCLSQTNTYWRN